MTLLKTAHERLFPKKEIWYTTKVVYSKRPAPYNATLKLQANELTLHAHSNWQEVDDEITIGLAQWLLLKLFKKKTHTYNIELYTNFIKQLPTITPKIHADTQLLSCFNKINAQFFAGSLERPNLKWGKAATRRLASYDYHTDTVTVSSIFKQAPQHLVDFLMYHELLHKHLQFECNKGRQQYHTKEFRRLERQFPQFTQVEKELNHFASRAKKPKIKKKPTLLDFFKRK